MTVRWTLTPGRFKPGEINPVSVLVDHEDVKVFEIDFDSKYPGEIWVQRDGDTVEVEFLISEYSIKLDDAASGDTVFKIFDVPDWAVVTDGSRYTVRVVVYRDPRVDVKPDEPAAVSAPLFADIAPLAIDPDGEAIL